MLLDTSELEKKISDLERRLRTLEAEAERNKGTVNETQAAEFLNISKSFLWKLRTRGEIPYVKLGSHTVYLRSDLSRYLETKRRRRGVNAVGF